MSRNQVFYQKAKQIWMTWSLVLVVSLLIIDNLPMVWGGNQGWLLGGKSYLALLPILVLGGAIFIAIFIRWKYLRQFVVAYYYDPRVAGAPLEPTFTYLDDWYGHDSELKITKRGTEWSYQHCQGDVGKVRPNAIAIVIRNQVTGVFRIRNSDDCYWLAETIKRMALEKPVPRAVRNEA